MRLLLPWPPLCLLSRSDPSRQAEIPPAGLMPDAHLCSARCPTRHPARWNLQRLSGTRRLNRRSVFRLILAHKFRTEMRRDHNEARPPGQAHLRQFLKIEVIGATKANDSTAARCHADFAKA